MFVNNTQLEYFYVSGNENLNGSLPPLPTNSSLKCLDIRDTGITGIPPGYLQIQNGELFLPASGFNISQIKENIEKINSDMKCQKCICEVKKDDSGNFGRFGWGCDDLCDDGVTYKERIGWRPRKHSVTEELKFSEYIWCNSWEIIKIQRQNIKKWRRNCQDLPLVRASSRL